MSSISKTTELSQRQYSQSISDTRGIEIYNSPSVAKTQDFGQDIDKLIGSLTKGAVAMYQLSDDAMRRVAIDHMVQYEEQKASVLSNTELDFDGKKAELAGIISRLNESVADKIGDSDRNRQIYDDVFTNKVRPDFANTVAKIDIEQNRFLLDKNREYLSTAVAYAPYLTLEEAKAIVQSNISQGDMSETELEMSLVEAKSKALVNLYSTNKEALFNKDGTFRKETLVKYFSDYTKDGELDFEFTTENETIKSVIAGTEDKLIDMFVKEAYNAQVKYSREYSDEAYKYMTLNSDNLQALETGYKNLLANSNNLDGGTFYTLANAFASNIKALRRESLQHGRESQEDIKDLFNSYVRLAEFNAKNPAPFDSSSKEIVAMYDRFIEGNTEENSKIETVLASLSEADIDPFEKELIAKKIITFDNDKKDNYAKELTKTVMSKTSANVINEFKNNRAFYSSKLPLMISKLESNSDRDRMSVLWGLSKANIEITQEQMQNIDLFLKGGISPEEKTKFNLDMEKVTRIPIDPRDRINAVNVSLALKYAGLDGSDIKRVLDSSFGGYEEIVSEGFMWSGYSVKSSSKLITKNDKEDIINAVSFLRTNKRTDYGTGNLIDSQGVFVYDSGNNVATVYTRTKDGIDIGLGNITRVNNKIYLIDEKTGKLIRP